MVVSARPDGLLKWRASGRFVMPVQMGSELKRAERPFLLGNSIFLPISIRFFNLKTVIS